MGNDIIEGGIGRDKLDGGFGNDIINGGAGGDQIDEGDGNDDIDGGFGDDKIDGGRGNDVIYGDWRDLNDAITEFTSLIENASLFSLWEDISTALDIPGQDDIDGGTGDDRIDGNFGDDVLIGNAGSDFIHGGDQVRKSSKGDYDMIVAGTLTGDDHVEDEISAGKGDAVIYRKEGRNKDDVSNAEDATSLEYEQLERQYESDLIRGFSVGWTVEGGIIGTVGASRGWFFELVYGEPVVIPFESHSYGVSSNVGGSTSVEFGWWNVDRHGFAGKSHFAGGSGGYIAEVAAGLVFSSEGLIGTVAKIGVGLSVFPAELSYSYSTTILHDSIWEAANPGITHFQPDF